MGHFSVNNPLFTVLVSVGYGLLLVLIYVKVLFSGSSVSLIDVLSTF